MQATSCEAETASSGTSTDADDGASSSGNDRGRSSVELPLHVTEKILCCINPLQSARLATVSKSWAATVSARLARPVPHLYACTPPDNNSDCRGLVLSIPLDGSRSPSATVIIPSRVRSSHTIGLRCIGATRSGRVGFGQGWWSRDVVLANPITGSLRSIDVGKPYWDPRYSRVLAGGDVDSFLTVHDYKLTLWRRRWQEAPGGAEEAWSSHPVAAALHDTNRILSAVNCNNGCRFYLLHLDGCLSKIDTTSPLRMEKLPVESLTDKFGFLSVTHDCRMLESDGEVLFVRQRPAYNAVHQSCSCLSVAGFEVYRLDVKEERWTKLEELAADRALFVSPGSSFSVRASETEGCRSNCIYFASEKRCYWNSSATCNDHEDGQSSWGVYSMDDRRVLFESAVTEPGREIELTWFLPRVV